MPASEPGQVGQIRRVKRRTISASPKSPNQNLTEGILSKRALMRSRTLDEQNISPTNTPSKTGIYPSGCRLIKGKAAIAANHTRQKATPIPLGTLCKKNLAFTFSFLSSDIVPIALTGNEAGQYKHYYFVPPPATSTIFTIFYPDYLCEWGQLPPQQPPGLIWQALSGMPQAPAPLLAWAENTLICRRVLPRQAGHGGAVWSLMLELRCSKRFPHFSHTNS